MHTTFLLLILNGKEQAAANGAEQSQRMTGQKSNQALPENSQGGGFPRSIVTKERGDLVLVEGNAKTVHGWSAVGLKNLHQIFHTYPRNQAWKFTFKEGVLEEKNEHDVSIML